MNKTNRETQVKDKVNNLVSLLLQAEDDVDDLDTISGIKVVSIIQNGTNTEVQLANADQLGKVAKAFEMVVRVSELNCENLYYTKKNYLDINGITVFTLV